MATGDTNDMISRIKATLAPWFADITPVLDSLLSALATGWAYVYWLFTYAKAQTRLKTLTDGFLDLFAMDFFGSMRRRLGETDDAFRTRIKINLFRERGTRKGLITLLTDLTGRVPILFEPARPQDAGGLGVSIALGAAGGIGTLLLPFQSFLTVFRPPFVSVPNIPGLGTGPAGLGITQGGMVLTNGSGIGAQSVSDADIYAAIESVKPAGDLIWVNLTNTSSAGPISQAQAIQLALQTNFPTPSLPVVAIKTAIDRWIIRTPVVGGAPTDYAEWAMYDNYVLANIAHAWAMHSIRGSIGGTLNRFLEGNQTDYTKIPTLEFAMNVGRMSDASDPTKIKFYGFGHLDMNYLGCLIQMDDSGPNMRDNAPPATVLKGSKFVVNGSYAPTLYDGTVIGTTSVAHIFDATGLLVSHQHNITAAGIGNQNSYSAMLPATGIDTIKPIGKIPLGVGYADGAQVGNWGPINQFALYSSAAPNALLEMILPYGNPGVPTGDWSGDTTSATFLIQRTDGIRKLYVNWRSGNSLAPVSGVSSHATRYQVRAGTPL